MHKRYYNEHFIFQKSLTSDMSLPPHGTHVPKLISSDKVSRHLLMVKGFSMVQPVCLTPVNNPIENFQLWFWSVIFIQLVIEKSRGVYILNKCIQYTINYANIIQIKKTCFIQAVKQNLQKTCFSGTLMCIPWL